MRQPPSSAPGRFHRGPASPRRSGPPCWRAPPRLGALGGRSSSALTQAKAGALVRRADRITAVMPTISNLRRYLSPIFVIRPSLALPPVECWRGTRPSHAARWRPDRNSVAPEQKEEIAKAMAVNRATRRTEKRAWRKSKSSWCDPRMIHLCFRSDHSASERLHQRRQASQRGHPESTALMNGREEVPTTKLVRVSLVARILDPRIESCHHMTLLRNENAHATAHSCRKNGRIAKSKTFHSTAQAAVHVRQLLRTRLRVDRTT
jgi:hypothetical protein